jgi:hypothetical protein
MRFCGGSVGNDVTKEEMKKVVKAMVEEVLRLSPCQDMPST